MRAYNSLWQPLATGLVLVIIVVFQLLVPINPDFSLPVLPELISIGLFSSILCVAFSGGEKLLLPGWFLRQSEQAVLSLLWLTVLCVTGLRAFMSLFHTPGQVWIPCLSIPGLAPQIECISQASITQHYGYRTFFMLVTAVLLGTLAWLIARSLLYGWQLLLGAVVFGPLLVAVVGFFCIFLGIEQALPKSLMHNDYGFQRLTQIFGNPGWVWPYFAPGLAVILWAIVADSNRLRKIAYAVILIVLILGILGTQQRGGLLLCLVYLAAYGFYYLTCGFKRKNLPRLAGGATLLISLVGMSYLFFSHQNTLQSLAHLLSYEWKSAPIFFDVERINIWKAAWHIFKQSPVFGHGYASWFQMISEYERTYNIPDVAFDTAHNLFLQMLVELGLLHTALILTVLGLIVITALQSSRLLPAKSLLLLLAVSSFVVPTLVQEINYIRPTFYIHTIFWGTLVGLPFYEKHQYPPRPYLRRKGDRLPKRTKNSAPTKLLLRISLIGLTTLSLMGTLFCAFNFSLGASAFETSLRKHDTKIVRWLGPSVTLAAFTTAERKSYSIYDVNPIQKPITVDFGKNAHGLRVILDGQDELFLALENGGRYWPQRHNIFLQPGYPDNTRWISAQTSYPPQQSNLGIGWSRNMYSWETFSGRKGRWCSENCVFLAKTCGEKKSLDFAVHAPRPDYSEVKPLDFIISVYGLVEETELPSDLSKLPVPLLKVNEQLTQEGEEKLIHVNGTLETAWYLVNIQAEPVFNPKSLGLSQDSRNLTVVISEVNCRDF